MTWLRQVGIGGRLLLAFGAIATLTVVASTVAWLTFGGLANNIGSKWAASTAYMHTQVMKCHMLSVLAALHKAQRKLIVRTQDKRKHDIN